VLLCVLRRLCVVRGHAVVVVIASPQGRCEWGYVHYFGDGEAADAASHPWGTGESERGKVPAKLLEL
jgi:hypothetical protein